LKSLPIAARTSRRDLAKSSKPETNVETDMSKSRS